MNRLPAVFLALQLLAGPAAGRDWARISRARLDESAPYDGDSFTLRSRRDRGIYRIYFVDAPETGMEFPDRVRDQAAYWGIEEADVLRLGKEAAAFARRFLRGGVTVWTRREDALGRSRQPRHFALIRSGEKDLGVELVRHGLGRVFGRGTDLPEGVPERQMWAELRRAEAEARREGLGAWGVRPGAPGTGRRSPP